MKFDQLLPQITQIINDNQQTRNQKLQEICNFLRQEISYYNWVGFYFHDPIKPELHLGPYAGEPTDHTTIPFGKGICGQVALSNQNFVVSDVTAQDNYIACSLTVKSEIVVPIFVNNKNIGQIDIDSHILDPFTQEDEKFLEQINQKIAQLF